MPGNQAQGKIIMKSPVGQQYKEGSKVKFFDIEASIDSVDIMPEPGLTANCRIILKQVKDTITIPQIAIFEEDSMKMVYVKKKNGFEARQIKTGLTSSKEAIISEGLFAKEQIGLAKPNPSSIKSKVLLPVEIQETDSANKESDELNITGEFKE